ncbi:hypothetical protein [Altererythrobacter sp. ZODW24]|uniref:CC0125/CC1285 family lipoprotein n=1 Tax=Altererythrobacter sp. ZODW24 TaxID=2185142 RepID=UPI001F081EA6|nr:hypothetical protein [Altererythrobacter sp. ZODW24]
MPIPRPIRTMGTILMAFVLTLSGCATSTPYQPDIPGQKVSGGFSETRLAADRYRVNFAGNCFTSRERVEGYLLYRAAELTVENGNDWFAIIDRLTERDTRTYVHPDPSYRPVYGSAYGYWRPHWRYYRTGGGWIDWHPEWGDPFWATRSTLRTVEKFTAHAEIVMGEGAKPEDDFRAFDARRVMADLESTIERPGGGGVQPC